MILDVDLGQAEKAILSIAASPTGKDIFSY